MENQTNDALPRRGNSRRFFLSWQAAEEGSQGVGEGREQPFGHVYAYGRYGWVVKIWPQSRSLSLSLSPSHRAVIAQATKKSSPLSDNK